MNEPAAKISQLFGLPLDAAAAGLVGAFFLQGVREVPQVFDPKIGALLQQGLGFLWGLEPVLASELAFTAVIEGSGA